MNSERTQSSSLYARTGPLTRDLLLAPGDFGLGMVPGNLKPDRTANMICGFCSTGCGLTVHLRENNAVNVTPAVDYPVNGGMACPKGWESLAVLDSRQRATTPLYRESRQARYQRVSWDFAMRQFCDRLRTVQRRWGPEAVAFLSTGQIATEEMALLGSLAKFGMGMLHGDGNTRQCMATSVLAYKQSFGFDAPPYTYRDFEESDVIVLIGSNLCVAHPIMWQRICQNTNSPTIIVVDPRTTETAMCASEHVALRPKSDLVFLYGLANILIERGWIDQSYIDEHTREFDAFREHVRAFSLDVVEKKTGIERTTLQRIAATIHQGKRVSLWWTMGVNQSYEGVRTAQAIINIALMTGNIGRPGTGANSITGQCNAMGSRLFSNTTNLLAGHDFENSADRQKIARILGFPADRIPTRNSWAYPDIIEGILKEKIKALWVVCTNPAHSWINQHMCHDVIDRLDFLAVQDMYHDTETAQRADLVLPAAGWGEKEGTFINSERRIGVIKKVAQAPGQALADFSIFRLVAEYWGCGKQFAKWKTPADTFQILKACSRGQPCDISGIRDYRMLDECGGVQWPFPSGGRIGGESHERRLFEDGRFFHSDGRARFVFGQPGQMPESPGDRYPYLLLTGRGTAAQWHTQTRTRRSAVLRSLHPSHPYVEVNPKDARREGLEPNEWVIIESARGRMRAKAVVTPTIRSGQLFVPMHYRDVNKLTHAHFDPYSKQPSYKDCAVRIRALESWD